jgi:hypothetical protein
MWAKPLAWWWKLLDLKDINLVIASERSPAGVGISSKHGEDNFSFEYLTMTTNRRLLCLN